MYLPHLSSFKNVFQLKPLQTSPPVRHFPLENCPQMTNILSLGLHTRVHLQVRLFPIETFFWNSCFPSCFQWLFSIAGFNGLFSMAGFNGLFQMAGFIGCFHGLLSWAVSIGMSHWLLSCVVKYLSECQQQDSFGMATRHETDSTSFLQHVKSILIYLIRFL